MKWAKQHGLKSIRLYFGPGVASGWPDDLFLIPGGCPVFIEFKAPGKEATPTQAKKIKLLRELDYIVEVCDSKEAAIAVLEVAIKASW